MKPEKDTKIGEIAAAIRNRIDEGIYVAGQRLPSERDLANELGVSRITVRSALLRLQAENVIDVVPRGGVFIRAASTKAVIGSGIPAFASGPELQQFGSFIRAMEFQGKETLVRFIQPSTVSPVGEEIGKKMGVPPETEVLRRYRMHIVERVPYRILDSYYLASLLGDLLGNDAGYIPLFKWLRERTGIIADNAFERLNCRMPSEEEARLLNIARNQPVVDLDRWVWGNNKILFEYTHIVANASLHEFTYSYKLSEEASK